MSDTGRTGSRDSLTHTLTRTHTRTHPRFLSHTLAPHTCTHTDAHTLTHAQDRARRCQQTSILLNKLNINKLLLLRLLSPRPDDREKFTPQPQSAGRASLLKGQRPAAPGWAGAARAPSPRLGAPSARAQGVPARRRGAPGGGGEGAGAAVGEGAG